MTHSGQRHKEFILTEDELIEIFQEEADELLGKWESITLSLESDHGSSVMNDFFRIAHTLKGSSKAVGLHEFGSFVHNVEDLIKHCQNDISSLDKKAIQIFLNAHTAMVEWLEKGQRVPQSNDIENEVKSFLGKLNGVSTESVDSEEANINVRKFEDPVNASKKSTKKVVIRVDRQKIDHIVNLAGELGSQLAIVQREQLLNGTTNEKEQTALSYALKYLSSLEEVSLSLSMQPLEGLFQRLERACIDVANLTDKEIVINKVGTDVELDRTVLDRITEPLIHLVRNGVDHGIESRNKREEIGKKSWGSISFTALQESGMVKLIIEDDGAGIDEEKVLEKAISKGLVMSSKSIERKQIQRLILEPGFSTKTEISEVSGRGVGMDVVNTALIELGGGIDIESEKGKGTRFTISLPTTISIVESVIIEDNSTRFAVPLRDCSEILDLDEVGLKRVESEFSVNWHDSLVPVQNLESIFGTSRKNNSDDKRMAIVNKIDGHDMAFRFDRMIGSQKLFVKPLKGDFENMFGITGTSILSDGSASLILNLNEIARSYHRKFREVSGV